MEMMSDGGFAKGTIPDGIQVLTNPGFRLYSLRRSFLPFLSPVSLKWSVTRSGSNGLYAEVVGGAASDRA